MEEKGTLRWKEERRAKNKRNKRNKRWRTEGIREQKWIKKYKNI